MFCLPSIFYLSCYIPSLRKFHLLSISFLVMFSSFVSCWSQISIFVLTCLLNPRPRYLFLRDHFHLGLPHTSQLPCTYLPSISFLPNSAAPVLCPREGGLCPFVGQSIPLLHPPTVGQSLNSLYCTSLMSLKCTYTSQPYSHILGLSLSSECLFFLKKKNFYFEIILKMEVLQ